jgi:hypothetical protein
MQVGHRHEDHTAIIARQTPIMGNGRADSGANAGLFAGPLPKARFCREPLSTGFREPDQVERQRLCFSRLPQFFMLHHCRRWPLLVSTK